MRVSILFLIIFVAAAVCASAQQFDGSGGAVDAAEIYLARDDGSGKAGDEATEFITTDIPIYCVVQLDSAEPVTVKMNLFAVSVAGVKSGTKVVSLSYTTKDGEDRVNFSGRPQGKWVVGKYRVDILVGDRPARSIEFSVRTPDPQKRATAVKLVKN